MRFQWWQTVLLECDSNLANGCCVIEKILFSERVFFHFLTVNFLPVVRKTDYIDTNNNLPQIVQ